MKSSAFLIFFSIVLLVYSAINFYIFIRGYQSLQLFPALKRLYVWVFIPWAASYVAGRFLERTSLYSIGEWLSRIGSFWLAAMVYFLLILLLLDLLRLVNHFLPYFPAILTANPAKTKLILFLGALITVGGLILYGYINARNPVIRQLPLTFNKPGGSLKAFNLVYLSDIHLGSTIGRERLGHMVEKINALNPDLVIFGGDVMDEDIAPVIRRNLGEQLQSIRSKYGVIAVTGNHEYIGGAEKAVAYMQDHGITVLRDSAMVVGGSLLVAGREDKDRPRFSGKNRKEISEILQNQDLSLPIILIDHQPFQLQKAVDAGIDLQLSGHTHHGQMWPFNYITEAVYELSRGYLLKGETHFYVSNGVGTWGPPVRIGNRPEIVQFTLNFMEN